MKRNSLQRFADEEDLLERSTNKPKMGEDSQVAMDSNAADGSSSPAQHDTAAANMADTPTDAMPTDAMDSDATVDSSYPKDLPDLSATNSDFVAETQPEAMAMPSDQDGIVPPQSGQGVDAAIPSRSGPGVASEPPRLVEVQVPGAGMETSRSYLDSVVGKGTDAAPFGCPNTVVTNTPAAAGIEAQQPPTVNDPIPITQPAGLAAGMATTSRVRPYGSWILVTRKERGQAGRPQGTSNQRTTAGQNAGQGRAQGNVAARGSRFVPLETECESEASPEGSVPAAIGSAAANQNAGGPQNPRSGDSHDNRHKTHRDSPYCVRTVYGTLYSPAVTLTLTATQGRALDRTPRRPFPTGQRRDKFHVARFPGTEADRKSNVGGSLSAGRKHGFVRTLEKHNRPVNALALNFRRIVSVLRRLRSVDSAVSADRTVRIWAAGLAASIAAWTVPRRPPKSRSPLILILIKTATIHEELLHGSPALHTSHRLRVVSHRRGHHHAGAVVLSVQPTELFIQSRDKHIHISHFMFPAIIIVQHFDHITAFPFGHFTQPSAKHRPASIAAVVAENRFHLLQNGVPALFRDNSFLLRGGLFERNHVVSNLEHFVGQLGDFPELGTHRSRRFRGLHEAVKAITAFASHQKFASSFRTDKARASMASLRPEWTTFSSKIASRRAARNGGIGTGHYILNEVHERLNFVMDRIKIMCGLDVFHHGRVLGASKKVSPLPHSRPTGMIFACNGVTAWLGRRSSNTSKTSRVEIGGLRDDFVDWVNSGGGSKWGDNRSGITGHLSHFAGLRKEV
nr:hypothetical protein Iba_chr08aCG3400 [Ipomoea batatas]